MKGKDSNCVGILSDQGKLQLRKASLYMDWRTLNYMLLTYVDLLADNSHYIKAISIELFNSDKGCIIKNK